MRGGPGGGSKGASVIIVTLEGREVATPGYQIIQGIRGEFYPCEENIFADSYEMSPPPDSAASIRAKHLPVNRGRVTYCCAYCEKNGDGFDCVEWPCAELEALEGTE